jgi:hypothetical protein
MTPEAIALAYLAKLQQKVAALEDRLLRRRLESNNALRRRLGQHPHPRHDGRL